MIQQMSPPSARHGLRRSLRRSMLVGVATVGLFASVASAAGPGTWTPTANTPIARFDHVAVRLNDGRVLVAGGQQSVRLATGFNSSVAPTTTEIYDPATGQWSTTGSLAVGRTYPQAATLADGRVLITGGGLGPGAVKTTEIYNPATGTWSAGKPMLSARSQNMAIRLSDGRVLVAGGTSSGSVSGEVYTPATNKWTATGATPTTNAGSLAPSGVLLPDGRVVSTLGIGYYGGAPSIFNPTTNSWTSASTPPVFPGFGAKVALLPDGHVLFAGGSLTGSWSDVASNVVVEFDPVANTWIQRPSANFLGSYGGASLTTLTNGTVLATGGVSDRIYDPTTATWSVASISAGGQRFTVTALADGRAVKVGGNTGQWPAGGVGPTIAPYAAVFQP